MSLTFVYRYDALHLKMTPFDLLVCATSLSPSSVCCEHRNWTLQMFNVWTWLKSKVYFSSRVADTRQWMQLFTIKTPFNILAQGSCFIWWSQATSGTWRWPNLRSIRWMYDAISCCVFGAFQEFFMRWVWCIAKLEFSSSYAVCGLTPRGPRGCAEKRRCVIEYAFCNSYVVLLKMQHRNSKK